MSISILLRIPVWEIRADPTRRKRKGRQMKPKLIRLKFNQEHLAQTRPQQEEVELKIEEAAAETEAVVAAQTMDPMPNIKLKLSKIKSSN